MKKESHEVKLARIEEGIKYLKKDVSEIKDSIVPLVESHQRHGLQIALLKRDKKWRHWIAGAIGAFIGWFWK